MDCAACGKPLSVTAKFCGKCGAPVKRVAKSVESEAPAVASEEHARLAITPEGQATTNPEHATHHEEGVQSHTPSNNVEDLIVTLTASQSGLDDSSLMMLDLNLVDAEKAVTPVSSNMSQSIASSLDTDLLSRLEVQQHELKKTLEKHSLLLDFISLASQQQTHQQSQPDPNEELLHGLIEKQTQFAVQLAALHQHLQDIPTAAPGRLPEEFRLLLEKQKIEIQKSFSQNVAQNTENLTQAQQIEMTKVQEMLKANTLAAEGIEKNLAPLIQSVNDLKTKVQAVVKKVEDQAAARPKLSGKEEPASEGGGFMVFVIGMLCGLTVVLSSLAIYNFLTHEKPSPDSGGKSHEKAASDSGDKSHDKASTDSAAKSKSAH
jgi:hypothetical protein